MKNLIITIFIVIFGHTQFGWVIGFAVPGSTSIAYSEQGQCVVWEGAERTCNFDEIALMVSLSKLIDHSKQIGIIYE